MIIAIARDSAVLKVSDRIASAPAIRLRPDNYVLSRQAAESGALVKIAADALSGIPVLDLPARWRNEVACRSGPRQAAWRDRSCRHRLIELARHGCARGCFNGHILDRTPHTGTAGHLSNNRLQSRRADDERASRFMAVGIMASI